MHDSINTGENVEHPQNRLFLVSFLDNKKLETNFLLIKMKLLVNTIAAIYVSLTTKPSGSNNNDQQFFL